MFTMIRVTSPAKSKRITGTRYVKNCNETSPHFLFDTWWHCTSLLLIGFFPTLSSILVQTDELNEMKSMKLHVDDYDCEDLKCIGHTTTCAIQAQQDALARAATMANEVHVYRSEYEIEETMKIIDEVLDMLQGDDLF